MFFAITFLYTKFSVKIFRTCTQTVPPKRAIWAFWNNKLGKYEIVKWCIVCYDIVEKTYVHVFSYFGIFHQPGNNLGSSIVVWKKACDYECLIHVVCVHDSKSMLRKHSLCILQCICMINKNLSHNKQSQLLVCTITCIYHTINNYNIKETNKFLEKVNDIWN